MYIVTVMMWNITTLLGPLRPTVRVGLSLNRRALHSEQNVQYTDVLIISDLLGFVVNLLKWSYSLWGRYISDSFHQN